ncbi:hypothetical protein YC2023_052862 [Brassica napus]
MYNAPGSSAPFILSVPCLLRSMALAYGELKPDLRMYWFVFFTDYLQRELSVVHSDLKPENVLVPSMIGPSKVPRKSESKERCAKSIIEYDKAHGVGSAVNGKPLNSSEEDCPSTSASSGLEVKQGVHKQHSSETVEGSEHLPLMMELLGMMPRKIALGGRYSRDLFNRHGDLGHIRRLRFWPMSSVSLTFLDQLWSSLSTTFSFTQT